MLTLDEAITHAKEVAEEKLKDYERACALNVPSEGFCECASEHKQLAEWLTELQERREADRWIPISERLPEQTTTYLVTVKFIEDYEECIMTDMIIYNIKYGWMTVDEVIAWKPLPEPYERGDE